MSSSDMAMMVCCYCDQPIRSNGGEDQKVTVNLPSCQHQVHLVCIPCGKPNSKAWTASLIEPMLQEIIARMPASPVTATTKGTIAYRNAKKPFFIS
jgi:hypothetical protein